MGFWVDNLMVMDVTFVVKPVRPDCHHKIKIVAGAGMPVQFKTKSDKEADHCPLMFVLVFELTDQGKAAMKESLGTLLYVWL